MTSDINRSKVQPPLTDATIAAFLEAAKIHVIYDGWSDMAFYAAIKDTGLGEDWALASFPRKGVDMAIAYHRQGDAAMRDLLSHEDLSKLRYRDRVARAIRIRLDAAGDKEVVRRASSLFVLPLYAPEGAALIWETADAIWNALGDTSNDFNWYTKRIILSSVYASVVLYWLGDDSPESSNTIAFINRRIDNVMQFEKTKAQLRSSKIFKKVMARPIEAVKNIKAPQHNEDLPGHIPSHGFS